MPEGSSSSFTSSVVWKKVDVLLLVALCLNNIRLGCCVCVHDADCPIGSTCVQQICQQYIPKCAKEPGICGNNSQCHDAKDSYICTCNVGYSGSPPNETCTDIDECDEHLHICGPNAVCVDTMGSYTCTCEEGYLGFPPSQPCTYVEVCTDPVVTCGNNTVCTNNTGTPICTCSAGYSGVPPNQTCTNIDECKEHPGICGNHSTCTDATGSYTCTCEDGFEGAPSTHLCSNIDECESIPGICGENAICADTIGSYNCTCVTGYAWTATESCTNINECLTTPDICVSNSICTDTEGSYRCSCGYFYFPGTNGDSRNYSSDVKSTTVITAPHGLHIWIKFTSVSIECCRAQANCLLNELETCPCIFDYVQVFDSNGSLLLQFCGTDNQSFTSSGETLTVTTVSDTIINFKGYAAIVCYV